MKHFTSMSFKPIDETTQYCVLFQKTLKSQQTIIKFDQNINLLMDEQFQVTSGEVKFSKMESNQPIQFKKFQLQCQTQPFDIRAAVYTDLFLHQQRSQFRFSPQLKATDLKTSKECEFMHTQHLLIMRTNNLMYILKPETLSQIYLKEDQLTVGFKMYVEDNLCLNMFKFGDLQSFNKFVDVLQQIFGLLNKKLLSCSQLIKRDFKEGIKFESHAIFFKVECDLSIQINDSYVKLENELIKWKIELNKIMGFNLQNKTVYLIGGEEITLYQQFDQIMMKIIEKGQLNDISYKIFAFKPVWINSTSPINQSIYEQLFDQVDFAKDESIIIFLSNTPNFPVDYKPKDFQQQLGNINKGNTLLITQLLLYLSQNILFAKMMLETDLQEFIESGLKNKECLVFSLLLLRNLLTLQIKVTDTVINTQMFLGQLIFSYQNEGGKIYIKHNHNLHQLNQMVAFQHKSYSEIPQKQNIINYINKWSQKYDMDKEFRTILFQPDSQITGALTDCIQKLPEQKLTVQCLIFGIIEDLLVNKSFLDTKWFVEFYNKLKKESQPIQQPIKRQEMLILISDHVQYLLDQTISQFTAFKCSICLALKYLLLEEIPANYDAKYTLCSTSLSSGFFLKHIHIILDHNQSKTDRTASFLFIASTYFIDKNVKTLFQKIFPKGLNNLLTFEKFDQQSLQYLQNLPILFENELKSFGDFIKQTFSEKYSTQIVWDDSLLNSLSSQIQQILEQLEQEKMLDPNLAWNYEEIHINHRGVSNLKYNKYDIYANSYNLGYILEHCENLVKEMLFLDNTNKFKHFLQYQRKKYLDSLNLIQFRELEERNKLIDLQQPKLLQSNLITILKNENCNIQSLQQDMFDYYIYQADTEEEKLVTLHCILLISFLFEQKFVKIEQMCKQAMQSIDEEKYERLLYQLLIIECCCYQIDDADLLKRSYWQLLIHNDIIYYLSGKLLPLFLYENGKNKFDQLIGENELIYNNSYGNLLQVTLRIIYRCIQQCQSTDVNGRCLYPQPKLYSILQSQSILPNFIGLLAICATNRENDTYQQVYIQICKIVYELCNQSKSNIDFFIKSGLIEMVLSNNFDTNTNKEIFQMLKQFLKTEPGLEVMSKLLPKPFINYMMIEKPITDISDIFCSDFFVSPLIIWNNKLRQILQYQLGAFATSIQEALQNFKKEECKAKLLNIKQFVEQNERIIPIIWFENIDQHYDITENYILLKSHKEYEIGHIYLDLFTQSDYVQTYEQISGKKIENQNIEFTKQLETIQNSLQLQEIVQIICQILTLPHNASLTEIKTNYDNNQLGPLSNFQVTNLTEATNFMLQIAFKQIQTAIIETKLLLQEQIQTTGKMKEFKSKTGLNGIVLLKQNSSLIHPDVLKQQRLTKLAIIFKFFAVLGIVYKAVTKIVSDSNKNFQQTSFNILDGLIELSKSIIALDCENLIHNIMQICPDVSEEDIKILEEISKQYKGEQSKQVSETYGLFTKMVNNVYYYKEFNKEFVDSINQLSQTILQSLNNESIKEIPITFLECLQQLFQKLYKPSFSFEESSETTLQALQNSILCNALKIITKLSSFVTGTDLLMQTNIPMFLIKGVFEKKLQFVTILKTLFNKETKPIFSMCLTPWITSGFEEGLNAEQIIEKSLKLYYSEKSIYNPQVKMFLQQQIDHFCQNCGIENVMIQFAQLLIPDKVLQYEIKIKNSYFGVIANKIIIETIQQVDEKMITKITPVSVNTEVLKIVEDVIPKFLVKTFGKEGLTPQDSNLLLQIQDPRYLTLILLLISIYRLGNSSSQLQKFLLFLAFQYSNSVLTELISEIAASQIDLEKVEANNLTPQLLYFITQNQFKGAESLIKQQTQVDPNKFRNAGYELGFTEPKKLQGFFKVNAFTNRKYIMTCILLNTCFKQEYKNLDVYILNQYLQNMQKQKENEINFKILNNLLPKSIFLQNMLPTPLQVCVYEQDQTQFIQLLFQTINHPELVWSQQCGQQFVQFIAQLAPQISFDNDVDLSIYSYFNCVKYLNETYTSQMLVVENVFLPFKGEFSLRNPIQLAKTLLQKILHILTNETDKLYLSAIYLESFVKILQRYKNYQQVILQIENLFELLMEKLLFDVEFCCGYYLNQQASQVLAQNVIQLLEIASIVKLNYGNVLHVTHLFLSQFVFYSYEDEKVKTNPKTHKIVDTFLFFAKDKAKTVQIFVEFAFSQILNNPKTQQQIFCEKMMVYGETQLSQVMSLLAILKYSSNTAFVKQVSVYFINKLIDEPDALKEFVENETLEQFEFYIQAFQQLKFQARLTNGKFIGSEVQKYPIIENLLHFLPQFVVQNTKVELKLQKDAIEALKSGFQSEIKSFYENEQIKELFKEQKMKLDPNEAIGTALAGLQQAVIACTEQPGLTQLIE